LCVGGVPTSHIVDRMYLFKEKVLDFNTKYVAK
jgi:hypothetical protein